MQVIHQDKDKRSDSGETDSVGTVIYVGRIGRHLEGKCIGRLRRRIIGIQDNWRIFGRHKKGVWERR